MKKILPLLLLCPIGFIACRNNPSTHPVVDKDSSGKSSREDVSVLPDSAMIALKMAAVVSIQDLISQRWNLEDVDRKHWDQFFWDTLSNKRKYPGICLFRDMTFTKNARCGINTGSWQLIKEERRLQLQFKDGTRENYIIRQVSLKTIIAELETGKEPVQVSFTSDALVHKRENEDPFYPANNTWRFKPRAPETREQIRARVRDCVHFYALFFKDNVERKDQDISFIGLPGCFTWYNGGIALTATIELDGKWKDCFYSEDQALEGYNMLNDLLQRHELKWPQHENSWVKETQSVLEQIYQKL